MEKGIESKKKERRENRFLTHTRPCRQCGLPLITCSKVPVVHDACRAEYYKLKAREYSNTKGSNRPSFRERDKRRYFINERACEACGYKEITKERNFFHREEDPTIPGNFKLEVKRHTLCLNCIMKYRFGMIEAISWKEKEVAVWMKPYPIA